MKSVHAPNTFPGFLESVSEIFLAYPMAPVVLMVAGSVWFACHMTKG